MSRKHTNGQIDVVTYTVFSQECLVENDVGALIK